MNPLTSKLIAREFHTHRWMMGGSILAGMAGLAVIARGGTMNFNVGFLIWLTTIVAFGVVVAMFGIASERKERVMNWVLSLPVAHGDYVRIKVLALLLCFIVVWLVLSAAAIGLVVAAPNLPDGLLPFAVLLCAFMVANYSFVVCSALHVHSEGPMTLVIIVHNIAITLFLFAVATIDDIQRHVQGPVAVWNSAFWTVLGIELAFILLMLSLPFLVAARRRDFI
jgi:ABC-type transport system involved in multi-copper enzyme maturation permease subunit